MDYIKVTESKDTLDSLFQYMYPQARPDLRKLEFKQLVELSAAAERYEVFGAIDMCSIQMRYVAKTGDNRY